MLPDATFDPVPPRPKRRLRFSLLALLIFVTLVSVGLAWLVQPNRVVATALFHIESVPPALLLGQAVPGRAEPDFEIVKKTQVALLKSHFVLTAALRHPSVASLPLLRSSQDPVEWLHKHLEAEFPENAEVLAIRLRGPEAQANDLVRIVDAVAKAYLDEVVFRDRQLQGAQRDMVARNLATLNARIERKWQQYLDIARETDTLQSSSGRVKQELDMRRLDRIETELMRLESDQLALETADKAGNAEFIEQRIIQLRNQQSELESKIASRGETSVELKAREQELNQLQRISNDLSTKLERYDINANASGRIRQIQPAVVGPAK